MPYIVRDLGAFTVVGSSGGAQNSSGIGHLDDAANIGIFFTATAVSTVTSIQVSIFDPADNYPQAGLTTAAAYISNWYTLSTAYGVTLTTGTHQVITNISFRGIRLAVTATSSGNGEILAYLTKQITV